MAKDPQNIDEALAEDQEADQTADTVDFQPQEEETPAEPSAEERHAAAEDRILRMQAELQNVLNRTRREVADVRKYGALDLARDLLPAIDTMDRAIEVGEKGLAENPASDPQGLTAGFKMVRDQIVTVLASHGCKPIAAEPGTEFDTNFHEAILQQPSEEYPAGTIVLAAQTGYQLHERVLRAAQVIVSSGPAE